MRCQLREFLLNQVPLPHKVGTFYNKSPWSFRQAGLFKYTSFWIPQLPTPNCLQPQEAASEPFQDNLLASHVSLASSAPSQSYHNFLHWKLLRASARTTVHLQECHLQPIPCNMAPQHSSQECTMGMVSFRIVQGGVSDTHTGPQGHMDQTLNQDHLGFLDSRFRASSYFMLLRYSYSWGILTSHTVVQRGPSVE